MELYFWEWSAPKQALSGVHWKSRAAARRRLAGDFQISFPLQQEETLKHTVRGGLLIFPQNKIHGQEEPRVVLYAYSHFPEHVDRFLEYQICQILCALEFVL